MSPISIPQDLMIDVALNPHFIATFTLFVAVILVGTIGIGKLFKHFFRLPVIAGQIIGGVILGPSLLNITHWSVFKMPLELVDNASGQIFIFFSSDIFLLFVIVLSSAITVAYLLWVAGYETDIKDMIKVGVTATGAGIFGALIPIGTIGALSYCIVGGDSLVSALGLGLIFAATSVSVPVAMLVAQHKMHLRTSKATLGAAIVDDIFAIILLSLFMLAVQSGMFGKAVEMHTHIAGVGESLGRMLIAFVALFVIGFIVLPKISKWLHNAKYTHLIAPFAFAMMLFYFSFAELFGGLAGITGAYFAGLFHRKGDERHRAERSLSPFINAVLLPLFLGSIGLQINVGLLSFYDWGWVIVFLFFAIISKLLGTYLAIALSNMSGRRGIKRWSGLEGYIFGSSMVARGEVGLVIATILRGTQIVSDSMYIVAVVVIVLTTIATPIMLSIGFFIKDRDERESKEALEEVSVLGFFDTIGTKQMFDIIVSLLERDFHGTSVHISEGQRILDVEDKRVRVVLSSDQGICVKGDKNSVEQILLIIREGLKQELERVSQQLP